MIDRVEALKRIQKIREVQQLDKYLKSKDPFIQWYAEQRKSTIKNQHVCTLEELEGIVDVAI